MKPNPYRIQIFVGAFLIHSMLIKFFKVYVSRFYMWYIPEKKFPHGSKQRQNKAENLSEYLYKALKYTFMAGFEYYALKDTQYLDTEIGGSYSNI
jgi:hypothetical protein